MDKLRTLDLFSGIGGFSLGLERAGGFETVAFCEIDPFCRKVLAKHWPSIPIFEDITKLTKKELEEIGRIDVICGGFPCQPVSCAGKRKGKEDERWLWPEFYRIVCEVKPRWVLVENVPGLLSADSGRIYGGILRDLASSGYDAEWNIVSAASVGAPHLRKRVFIVARQMADTESGRCGFRASEDQRATHREGDTFGDGCSILADPEKPMRELSGDTWPRGDGPTNRSGEVSDSSRAGLPQPEQEREHGRPTAERDWWAVEPDVGRVASRFPIRLDGGRCAKRNVMAAIIGDGEWIGYNSCLSPAEVCPRLPDEGYEKCASVCGQTNHAEINAIQKAGNRAKDALMVIYGHDHCCENCLSAINNAGIKKVIFADYDRVNRLRALGNAIVPQCAEYVGRCVLEAI